MYVYADDAPLLFNDGCASKTREKSQFIGNKISPVSREKIDGKTKVKYSYKGKTYNFCCATCVDDFKKDSQKYIKKIEEEKLQGKSKQEEHLSSESHQHSH